MTASYYAPAVALLTIFLAGSVAAWVSLDRLAGISAGAAAALLIVASAGLLLSDGLRPRYQPITLNFAASAEYAGIGHDVPRSCRRPAGPERVGARRLGLLLPLPGGGRPADPGWVNKLIEAHLAGSGGPVHALLALNFRFREYPDAVQPYYYRHWSRSLNPKAVAQWPVVSPVGIEGYVSLDRQAGVELNGPMPGEKP